jgi:hypothetical protein
MVFTNGKSGVGPNSKKIKDEKYFTRYLHGLILLPFTLLINLLSVRLLNCIDCFQDFFSD